MTTGDKRARGGTAGRLPNFLVIGAAKSGTSALWNFLRQHPEICMAVRKEPNFFSIDEIRHFRNGIGDVEYQVLDLAGYRALYGHARQESAIGEASNSTLYFPCAVDKVREHVPRARLIALLRQPADRAFSAYMHLRRDGREPIEDFRAALEAEDERIAAHWSFSWHYRNAGRYHRQLKPFYDAFGAERIRIFLYDDFRAHPRRVLREIFRFLGVDDLFEPTMKSGVNRSGIPRSPLLQSAMRRLFDRPNPVRFAARKLVREDTRLRFTQFVRTRNLVRREIPADVRRELTAFYRPGILVLQDLIARDLSAWLRE